MAVASRTCWPPARCLARSRVTSEGPTPTPARLSWARRSWAAATSSGDGSPWSWPPCPWSLLWLCPWSWPPSSRAVAIPSLSGVATSACTCWVWPDSSSSTWGTTSMTVCRLSTAPFGLPGRFRTRASPTTPVRPREMIAIGLTWRPTDRIVSARPGASRVRTALVASGVTSRGPKPVPPVVTTRSAEAAMRRMAASISGSSSATTAVSAISKPDVASRSASARPESSVRVPWKTPSLTVRMAARRSWPIGHPLLLITY